MGDDQNANTPREMELAIYISKAFIDEIGKERALKVIGKAYEQYMIDVMTRQLEGIPAEERLRAWGDFLRARSATDPNIKVTESSPKRIAVEVSRCIAYEACMKHEMPELCRERCEAERAAAKVIDPGVKVTRIKNIVAGDDCCQEVWELR